SSSRSTCRPWCVILALRGADATSPGPRRRTVRFRRARTAAHTARITMLFCALPGRVGARVNHPRGLWVLFITEMWERFSYYGMRALLVLYLIASTGGPDGIVENPGFGWSEEDAYLLYGLYTWAVYLTPIIGGWLADRYLGTHRSMLVGGWIIAAGH